MRTSGATGPVGHVETALGILTRSVGVLSTAATARMDAELDWFTRLGAEERSWVGVVVQRGIRAFVDWYGRDDPGLGAPSPIASEVFGAAPRALTRVITLRQTLDLVRLSLLVVEENLDQLLPAETIPETRTAVLRYGREVAFATAEVYARAAETRGAWDARLEALVVDSVLRPGADESVFSRAGALGWHDRAGVAVVIGAPPAGAHEAELFENVRVLARRSGMDALCGISADLLVVILGGVREDRTIPPIDTLCGEGAVVVGPRVDHLGQAHRSARAAMSAHRSAPGWPAAPRPVFSNELLPERVLIGDRAAARQLIDQVFRPLTGERAALLDTVSAYYDNGGSLEATARALFCHPNTVRYRLRRAASLTGFEPSDPRDAFAYQIALTLGRQESPADPTL